MERPKVGDIWYRYDSVYHYEQGWSTPEINIFLTEYRVDEVLRATVRLSNGGYVHPQPVLIDAKKRFAYPSKEEAWHSFKKRTQWRHMYADRALLIANELLKFSQQHESIPNMPDRMLTVCKGE